MRTRTFKSGNSEAVRLPQGVAFGKTGLELTVVRTGDVVTLYPVRSGTSALLAELAELPTPREVQERDLVEAPERLDG